MNSALAAAVALPLLVAAAGDVAAPAPAPECAPVDQLGVRLALQEDGQVPYALGLTDSEESALMLFASPETGAWTRVRVRLAAAKTLGEAEACIEERGTGWHVLPPLAPAAPEPPA